MIAIFYIIYFTVGIAILCITEAILLALSPLFDRRRHIVHRYVGLFAYHVSLLSTFWKVNVEQTENLNVDGPCIFVSNHQSFADISVAYALDRDFKWVAKDYLFKIPFLGAVMSMAGYVCMDQRSVGGIKRAMKRSRALLRQGESLFIFPEGTRSEDGLVQHFYDGAFKLASECDVPIVPVVLDGTFHGLPKNARSLKKTTVTLRVLPAVSPADFDYQPSAMRDHVKELISNELMRMRDRGEMLTFPVREIMPERKVS